MAVFDVSQSVIASSAGIIGGSTDVTPDMLDTLEASLEAMELGPLLGLFLQSFVIKLTMFALNTEYIYFRDRVWPYGGDLSADQSGPDPRGYPHQPGGRTDGPELSPLPVCRGLSRYADPCMRGHLCGARSGHCHRR